MRYLIRILDELRFSQQPGDTQTSSGQVHLVLIHTFDQRGEAPDYTSGWRLCLNALVGRLDGHNVPIVAGNVAREYGWQSLRDDYAELLNS